MRKHQVRAIFAAAVAGATPALASFPPPTTADPAGSSLATINTNYGSVQTYSSLVGFNPNTFEQGPDVLWFKYVSDGVTAVRFDTLGTNITTGGGGFTLPSTNETQMALYTASGTPVAISKNTVNLHGDPIPIYPTFSSDKGAGASNTTLGQNQYTPEELTQLYLAPTQSTNPHWTPDPYSTTYFTGWSAPGNEGNSQKYYQPYYPTNLNEYHVWSTALSPIILDNNGDPVLNTSNQTMSQPGWRYYDYARIGPGSTWNRYQVLPAGTYYLAVSSISPTFAGDTGNEAVLEAPIHFDYDTLQNEPILTGPLGTWQYYLDTTQNSFYGTVQLNVTQAPVQTQTVATLTGSTDMVLNATTLVVTNGGNYSGSLQDGAFQGLLTLTGGTLTLSGNNTLSGGITLAGGELSVSTDANLGDSTQAITFAGGTLGITGTTLTTLTHPLYWTASGGGFDIADVNNSVTTAAVLNGGGLTKTGAGTLVLTKAYTTTAPTTIAAGKLELSPASGTTQPTNNTSTAGISGAGSLSVDAGANLTSDAISVNTLTIGGSVHIRANGNSTSTLSALILAGGTDNWTGAFDLTNNKLIVNDGGISRASTIATLQNEIKYGKAHGNAGLFTSSTLPANVTLALLDNAVLNKLTFGGVNVNADSILIAPELLGDSNADGKVDLTDLSTVLNHFGTITSAWTSGNFDGGATVDLTDLSDVLNNFGLTYPTATSAPAIASTPEPASLATLSLATLPLLRRRRR
ncbi:MAG: autotransporter-associated beta strand repeat-containing protein [Phycisphaerae bacterium]